VTWDAADVPVFHDASGRAAVPPALVSLLGYSAMVGAVGGGGLGDLGIRYGYQRFMPEMLLAVVIVLIGLVQTVQTGRQHTYSDFFDEIPDAGGLFVHGFDLLTRPIIYCVRNSLSSLPRRRIFATAAALG
jgi:hypothetical protein